MMSSGKKATRAAFRDAVFLRDKNRCRMCNHQPKADEQQLDAHHITDRNLMPNGGYVAENGIALCAKCHEYAEEFHSTGVPHFGYSPQDLYAKIGSDLVRATKASERLSK